MVQNPKLIIKVEMDKKSKNGLKIQKIIKHSKMEQNS